MTWHSIAFSSTWLSLCFLNGYFLVKDYVRVSGLQKLLLLVSIPLLFTLFEFFFITQNVLSCTFYSHFFFITLLTITFFTDTLAMLISPFTTLYAIPLMFLISYFQCSSVTLFESIFGSIVSYLILYVTQKIALKTLGEEGLGDGDLDLIAFIGSFIGIQGSLISLGFGSFLGSSFGLIAGLFGYPIRSLRLPFGAFISFAAIAFTIINNFYNVTSLYKF